MAVLSDDDRKEVSGEFQSDASRERTTLAGVTKTDIKSAVDAMDTWIDTNFAALNTAIPQPLRSAWTKSMKVQLFIVLLNKRFLRGS